MATNGHTASIRRDRADELRTYGDEAITLVNRRFYYDTADFWDRLAIENERIIVTSRARIAASQVAIADTDLLLDWMKPGRAAR